MNAEVAEHCEKRNEQHTANADCADEQPHECRDHRECEKSNQPAAKLVSSLVSSTVSRFITA